MYLRQNLQRRAPTRIAGDVHHRRPGHIQTVVRRFIRRYASYGSYRIQIKRRSQTEAYRKDGSLAVYHVIGKKEEGFSGGSNAIT
ncbi:Uncharacterised protein [Salmonella enterica subsp. arizonae]|uniref:Uncharacterized protein n=1 Tax=Salmonella enterica subsp. arizonae TaxID=59203 RepID=A0A379SM52_SALER|nr:Uncharacterised protein [Salmonella enterica subsp. arizonae]